MRILCVGGGGREHAIVRALEKSGAEIFAVMKNHNPGIARLAKEVLMESETNVPRIVQWAQAMNVEMAVIGPEAPLALGIVDELLKVGIKCVGPTKRAAMIETSKFYARDLMRKHGIPGGIDYWYFDDMNEFDRFMMKCDFEIVMKPIGLTGGKGVRVWGDHLKSKKDAIDYASEIMAAKIGGGQFLVERKEVGEEFSLQVFSDGKSIAPMPLVQDHKRALEGDKGPNTGGMGSFSSADHLLPFVDKSDCQKALDIMRRTVEAMRSDGNEFRGILYGGFMNTKHGPRILEFNARFGDPEGMNVLPLLYDDFAAVCAGVAEGKMKTDLTFARQATVCKYVVPEGYGTSPGAAEPIQVDEKGIMGTSAELFYAAVNEIGGKVFTTSSRAVAVVGKAPTIEEANRIAEHALQCVKGNVFVRHDIGRMDYIQKKIDRMNAIRRG